MHIDRYEPDLEAVGDRESGVEPTRRARELCASARAHHVRGDAERAEEEAFAALDAWLEDGDRLEEEVLVELLQEVCGVASRAIVDTVLSARALAAWTPGMPRSGR